MQKGEIDGGDKACASAAALCVCARAQACVKDLCIISASAHIWSGGFWGNLEGVLKLRVNCMFEKLFLDQLIQAG